ncbi:hypothetical protein N7499_003097 [Penicillium canescens]|uniref:Uncharacterized protein n=1 Tax=Penicillium canescens TaxID=5083 RepID=A0AAD6IAJ5_PENCN|nr:uncharacterized protein N7446_011969 [Penicillium canescens]KAJ6019802.1 hypothetical protein N7522_000510 [Penicillium canescens]KAJ6039095.1 hypothetical protein N7460_007127 [Penicillium canescens]KAJ6047135.1 hypothetical protein N7446_011969 [Penicillium canescens]KAJ6059887.1 hypothetical protein N7444_003526 [Penicillium canescens]KAJ6093766.1 hypothetical protein N7499_003097 [Penicillium canescens]
MAEVEVYLMNSLRSLAAMVENQRRGQAHKLKDDIEFTDAAAECGHLWNMALRGGVQAPFDLSCDELSCDETWAGDQTKTKPKPNRLYENLCEKKWAPFELCQEAEETVWKWADNPDSFFDYTTESTAGSTPSMLDSVCRLLNHIEVQDQINTIRRRLLLCFLAEFVNERIQCAGTMGNMIALLVEANLVSPGSMQDKQVRDWRTAGGKYLALGKELGGLGSILCIPPCAPSDYETHYHPRSKGHEREEIIQLLQEQVLPAARRKRQDGRNAYEVVDVLRKHWRKKCPKIMFGRNLNGRQETSTTKHCRIRQSRTSPQTSRPGTPPPETRPPMDEMVLQWRFPPSASQSPGDSSYLASGGVSPTQLSFLTSSLATYDDVATYDDNCRVLPSTPMVI